MTYDFQVTIDASDPHTLADWWAETLGWQVEPSNEPLIRDMIDKGFASEDDTKTHNGTLVWKTGQAILHPSGKDGGRPRVLFQSVPEAKSVKNRLHLDVRPGEVDLDVAVDGLVARGATFLHRGQQGPSTWVTLTDPEGNEFCIG